MVLHGRKGGGGFGYQEGRCVKGFWMPLFSLYLLGRMANLPLVFSLKLFNIFHWSEMHEEKKEKLDSKGCVTSPDSRRLADSR